MMHLLHRTMPIIALAALVTVSPAGAQERDDSTSTARSVVSLVGLGANFLLPSGGHDETSRPNEWNCAGGCRAFGARSRSIAPFGSVMSAQRSSSRASSVATERHARALAERADLSDYGWSRRINTDGSPLGPVHVVPVAATAEDASPQGKTEIPTAIPTTAVPVRVPDGAGQAPAWVALGDNPADIATPRPATLSRSSEAGDNASNSAARSSRAVTSEPAVTQSGESTKQVGPLVTTVPEPSTVVLLAVGLSSLLFIRRRSTRAR